MGSSESDEQLSSKFLINIINDLPDGVLVEILCRLPYKYARRNKRVCKRWLALISDSYFAGRFLCIQIDKNKPITLLRTLLFWNRTAKPSPAGFTFRHIIFDALLWKTSIVALHFIPRFKGTKEKLLVAMYNDLVLCCLTKEDPHKYYICNPNAMQCVALPPSPPHHKIAQVGFICDPYYASQEQDNGGGTGISITTNDEYRCRVVRIIQLGNYLSQFKVDIFSSETGEWRESVVSCPQQSISFGFTFNRPGIAYNGMLYWPSYGGVIGFDPFAPHSSNYGCRFIEFDEPLDYTMTVACLGICQGRLRMCQLQTWMPPETLYNPYNNGRPLIVCVSELKEDEAAGGGRVKWCLIHKASLDEMDVGKHVFINDCIRFRYKIRVLAVDPNDGDVLYLEMCGYIIKCNIQARTLETPRGQRYGRNVIDFWPWRDVWTYVIPCWPTPLPRVGLPPLSRKTKREEKQTAIVSLIFSQFLSTLTSSFRFVPTLCSGGGSNFPNDRLSNFPCKTERGESYSQSSSTSLSSSSCLPLFSESCLQKICVPTFLGYTLRSGGGNYRNDRLSSDSSESSDSSGSSSFSLLCFLR